MNAPVLIGDAVLYHGDCLEILPTLQKVDAVITDIPYECSQESSGLRVLDYGAWDGAGAGAIGFKALTLCDYAPTVIAFCHWNQLSDISRLLVDRSWRPLIWEKLNPTVINGQHLFLPFGEFAYYGKRSGAWFDGVCIKAIWKGAAPDKREHPTEKPVRLMEWCVRYVSPPTGATLDPFMGSGTTGVACANLGRKFIGIEIEEKYFQIACQRIDNAYRQARLFA